MRNNNKGFVALFTCIMISLLLIIITVSLVSIEALQLRKSVDSEQSLRAYYAAEAGVEDAVSKVLAKTIKKGTGDETCNASSTFDTAGAAGWTCQWVSFTGSPTGRLEGPDIAKTVDPTGAASPYASVVVEWGQTSGVVPPLEITMVEYPPGGFNASQVGVVTKLKNIFLKPGPAAGPAPIVNFGAAVPSYNARCSAVGWSYIAGLSGYNCYAVINGLTAGQSYLYRIRSRNAATTYRMDFMSGNCLGACGARVDVPDGAATIDVTAKAGQTYRRVVSQLPLNPSAANGLNFVIYSDNNICKNFDVISDAKQPGCP